MKYSFGFRTDNDCDCDLNDLLRDEPFDLAEVNERTLCALLDRDLDLDFELTLRDLLLALELFLDPTECLEFERLERDCADAAELVRLRRWTLAAC